MIPPMGATLFYLWGVITGFKYIEPYAETDDIIKMLLLGLLILVIFIFICLLLSYIVILIAHFIGESIRVRAQIANDVRDLGDIHRAATLLREAEAAVIAEPAEGAEA